MKREEEMIKLYKMLRFSYWSYWIFLFSVAGGFFALAILFWLGGDFGAGSIILFLGCLFTASVIIGFLKSRKIENKWKNKILGSQDDKLKRYFLQPKGKKMNKPERMRRLSSRSIVLIWAVVMVALSTLLVVTDNRVCSAIAAATITALILGAILSGTLYDYIENGISKSARMSNNTKAKKKPSIRKRVHYNRKEGENE